MLAKINTPPLLSEQQLLDILEQYAEKVLITFMAPGTPGDLGASYGITSKMVDPNLSGRDAQFVLTMLNPTIIWPLLDQNGTANSKAQAALLFAQTLAHEMIHAIYKTKNILVPTGDRHRDEPLYAPPGTEPADSAWIAELGISWENIIIGGVVSECPNALGRIGSTGGGIFSIAAEAPNWHVWQLYERGVDAAGHEYESWYEYTIPPFVAVSYCSDDLWQVHFAKYGLPALRVPKLFRMTTNKDTFSDPEVCELEYAVPEFRSRLEELSEKLRIRESQWRCLRPWYVEKLSEWDDTPYSWLGLRNLAGRFRVAHRTGDEWTGQKCYKNLGGRENWGERFTSRGLLLENVKRWVVRAVAYLMMLVMPVRTNRTTRRLPFFPRDEHNPSAATVAEAAARSVTPFRIALTGEPGDWDEEQLATRNVPFVPDDPDILMGNRATLIAILRNEIPNRQREYPIPISLFSEVQAMLDNIDREAPKHEMPGQWMSDQIRFVLPPWRTEQANNRTGYSPSSSLYDPYSPSVQPRLHIPGSVPPPWRSSGVGSGAVIPELGSPSQRPGSTPPRTPGNSPVSDPESSDGAYISSPAGTSRRASPAHSARRRVAHSAQRAALLIEETYYTVGEVGNHLRTGDLWVVADDGEHGYDVYDVTDVMEETWSDEQEAFNMDKHCEWTLLGRKARPSFLNSVQEQGKRTGKLILPLRRHEIAERDGRHGKPFWISVGNDVFDITNFPFEGDKQRELMRSCPGGNPWSEIVKDAAIEHDQLVIDLKPFRCAVVASQTPEKGPSPTDEFHFTPQEVACHVYPETTIYTIIRGQVYNLTGYIEFHPGGEAMLQQWAGRDSTQEFERFHTDADRCLKDYDYLRVGRLVEEKSQDQLEHDEVALNGYVYDLSKTDIQEPAPPFLREINDLGLRGKDITDVLNYQLRLPPEDLLLLPQRPDLITAKLSVPLPEVDLATLRANDGRHIPLPEGMTVPRGRVGTDLKMPLWVSYNGLVYDMSAVSKWGPEDVKTQLNGFDHRHRGAIIPPSALATRLQQDYGCRVIGRLLMRSGRPRDEDGREGGDGDDRPHQRIRVR